MEQQLNNLFNQRTCNRVTYNGLDILTSTA